MENYPENSSLFFLSLAEREQLRPIVDLVQEILLQFRIVGQSESEAQQALSEIADAEFKKQCKARKINTGAALKIAKRLQREKWFCTYQSGATYGDLTGHDKARPVLIYSALTSDDQSAEQLNISENPDFYRIIQDSFEFPDTMSIEDFYAQQRKALNLTEQYRYIDVDHLDALFNVSDIFGARKDFAIQRLVFHRVSAITYPLDKPNARFIWNTEVSGQMSLFSMDIDVTKSSKKTDKLVTIHYAFDLSHPPSDVHISGTLDSFDKAVYFAAGALYVAGNDIVTINMIHEMMGNKTNPNSNDKKKINDSLTKMLTAHIEIDNQAEADAYNFPLFKYDSNLLPMERITVKARGQTTTAIHLLREPPLLTFAKERGQITAVDPAVFQYPLSKTKATLELADYIFTRVAHIKDDYGSPKILFSTIYKNTRNKTQKQQKRAHDKTITILNHWKSINYIKGYKESDDGITIIR